MRRDRRLSTAVACLALTGLGLGLGTIGVQTAQAAPSVTFGAEFLPWSYFDEGGIFSAGLTFSGSEYHGQVAPLTSLTLHLPAGTAVSSAGFPTCSRASLQSRSWWEVCPEGSVAGPAGSFTAVVYFGGNAFAEEGTVQPIFGPAGTLYFVTEASFPVSLEFIIEGHYEPASPPNGPSLVLQVPLIETEPSAPDISLTALTLELGATRQEAGGTEVNSVTLPSQCPSGGFAWSVEAGFNGEPATPVGATEGDCLQSGSHLRNKSTTSLEVSVLTPHEEQPETYTATVTPVGGGPVPTGAVAFYDGLRPIPGCQAQAVVRGATTATATCQVSYADLSEHRIREVYSGDENFRGSSSPTQTITVLEGPAPKEPPHEEPKPPAERPHEAPKGGTETPPLVTGGIAGPVMAPPLTAAQLVALLTPHGGPTSIASLLKHGGLAMPFQAPEAGALSVGWYLVPKGATLAKHSKPKPVLVAAGKLTFAAAGQGQLKLKLTAAGRQVLKHAKRVKLVAKATFAPAAGGIPVNARAVTTLR
jgi:hypothetical protein